MSGQLTDFVFPELGARGAVLEITDGIEEMFSWRQYTPGVRRLLGQAIAATPLLAAHSKFQGRINLQFQGSGALRLLVTQVDSQLRVRGMAKVAEGADGDFRALMQEGQLALMLEPDRGTQNYQAVVEIAGASLAEALENYFERSEQLPTLVRLAATPGRLSGLLLQRLPLGEKGSSEEHWSHLQALFATLGEQELAEVDIATLLRRLFHAEDLRLMPAQPVQLSCQCSHAGISSLLLGLGEAELAPVLSEFGKVEVTCEFCGHVYGYDSVQVRELFDAQKQASPDRALN